jgi:hypothetical protein
MGKPLGVGTAVTGAGVGDLFEEGTHAVRALLLVVPGGQTVHSAAFDPE